MRRGDSVFQDFLSIISLHWLSHWGDIFVVSVILEKFDIFAMRGLEIIKGKIQKMLGDSQIQNVAKPGRNQMRDLQL